MTYSPNLPKALIDLACIRANYRLLAQKAGAHAPVVVAAPPAGFFALPPVWQPLMPVLKADAYGHGHVQAALALREEGAAWFASGSVAEAVLLRQGLEAQGASQEQAGILSLLGLVEPGDSHLCAVHGIVPLLYDKEQLHLLEGLGSAGGPLGDTPLPVAVKCNSGMARLGFNEDALPALRERLKQLPVWPVLAVSHLHSADADDGRAKTREQAGVFARFLAALREDWPDLAASLGNSAGALLADVISGIIGEHVCRPGLALYGCNPFYGTRLAPLGQGLAPAMSVCAPIIATRTLAVGEGIGYGHTYSAPRDMPVGIVGAGYADSYSRSFSGRGALCVAGVRAPVIGRVSMQMTAVDLSAVCGNLGPIPEPLPEQLRTAWLLGGPHARGIGPEELAALLGTIPYEVLCLLGHNTRVYT